MQQLLPEPGGVLGTEPIQLEPPVILAIGASGADGDAGQPQHPVQEVGGEIHRPDPISRNGERASPEEAAAELDLHRPDLVAGGEPAQGAGTQREHQTRQAPERTLAAATSCQNQHHQPGNVLEDLLDR